MSEASATDETASSSLADGALLLQQLETQYTDRGQSAAWRLEKDSWITILERLTADPGGIGFNYRIESVLGIGGAAAVFRVIDNNLFADLADSPSPTAPDRLRQAYRALKVPRPHIEKGPTLADSLREEISRLTALSHPNVVSLFAKGQIAVSLHGTKTTWPWFVMGYVHEASDLDKLCRQHPPHLPVLIRFLYDLARGLKYVHDNGIVHCDIKPANIFVTAQPDRTVPARAILADFGYAKHITDRAGDTTVGFTEYFAHPELQLGGFKSSQESRTFKKLPRAQLWPAFDLFAFGMSIHYLLENFYKTHSAYRDFSYEIKYLRLCAARLLDGYNHQRSITYARLPYYCFADTGTPDTDSFQPGIKYRTADQLVSDLSKLVGECSPENDIPELIHTHRDNIQVSDVAPVIYSARVRKIVEHPLVRRLGSVTQLGLVSLVYPGAYHTRLEHALGTMGMTGRYLASLYRDTLDPLFRQLVDENLMKATLLAALLHDIGQYPLAHDLEDVSLEFFSHETFGAELLDTQAEKGGAQGALFTSLHAELPKLTKELGETLCELWQVPPQTVRRILSARNSENARQRQIGTHAERLCKSLIDGPIDADKVDYLQRDARHCNIQYGFGIDAVRLLRCLTVAHTNITDGHLLLVVGVHEKGRISAESILFARYAMLTQVYWHHTMRAIKALLHHAAAELPLGQSNGDWNRLRKDFFRCAILGEPVVDPAWQAVVGRSVAVTNIHAGDLRVLGWLWKNSTQSGRVAIEHLLNRQLFKRLLVIYRSDLTDKQRTTLEKVFRPERFEDRCLLRTSIQSALYAAVRVEKIPVGLLETQGFSPDEWRRRFEDATILRCLVDYPASRPGASFGLYVVGQWGEGPPKEAAPESLGPSEVFPMIIPGDHFKDGMKELEKSISCLRIFWRPDEFDVVKEVLGDARIKSIVTEELNRFVPLEEQKA